MSKAKTAQSCKALAACSMHWWNIVVLLYCSTILELIWEKTWRSSSYCHQTAKLSSLQHVSKRVMHFKVLQSTLKNFEGLWSTLKYFEVLQYTLMYTSWVEPWCVVVLNGSWPLIGKKAVKPCSPSSGLASKCGSERSVTGKSLPLFLIPSRKASQQCGSHIGNVRGHLRSCFIP